jgi:signal transduction histidine kinase
LLALAFAWVFDTSANCSLDLETITLLPQSAVHLVMHLALLCILGTGGAVLAILMVWAGPSPRGARGVGLRVLGWALLGSAAYRLWPREVIGLPLLPAVVLFALAATAGMMRPSLGPMLARASAGRRVGLALTAVGVAAALLYPSLVHFGEKSTRLQIERDHRELILRQPGWRDYVLEEARHKIDALEVLEETPAGPQRPALEELAFSVWSTTDLAAFGFSSAVEIQDPEGLVTSRFALNLPSLAAPPELPTDAGWLVTSERLTLGSIARPVLHARKLLAYHGEVHGAIHVYVGDDFWDLPFLTDRDPYSVLFRSASPSGVRGRPLGLLVYAPDQSLVFSSAERPPPLSDELRSRLEASASDGLWTTLSVDGRQTHAFLFADGDRVYGVTYPRLGAGRFAADLAEAAASLTLMALAGLLAVLALRDLLGRRTLTLSALASEVAHRFSLRLFVAFVAMALLPVIVLQLVVREFVADRLRRESERQALELAAIARKAVEDFAWMQSREPGGTRPVTDDALVYIASLIRNDLDVFAGGRLLASSKRELYASGLLPSRVEGGVYRALTLEGQPAALRTETIGGFSYLVVSVPARLETREPGLLSIPLAPRQREVEAVLDDLHRTIRLASLAFLAAAALLAQSVARRISGPIRDLTAATQRIARGDLAARVAPLSRDELHDLVESFNQMAGDLESQRRDLERSNRLAAWAEMARQVAHEVKNPLTPIQLSAEHLRRVFRDGGADFEQTLERCTDTILRQVTTLRRIVTEFSAFARPPATALEPQEMGALLEDVLAPYLAALPPEVTLRLERGSSPALVRGDRRLLERAVLNLVENALQAVAERGEIAVRLARREGRIEVEVEDNGPGLDPEIRERIFEPFFSTKTGGSGLGLALVKKIAEDHGGGVSLTSETGRYTRAVLWLPADPGASTPSGACTS